MAKRPDRSVPGIVVVDKPSGLTSHDVVSRMRRMAHTRKVGHAGTLDPMATGVLILGVGKATRLLTWITGHEKSYTATIRFGATTLSDDAQGELVEARGCGSIDEGALESAMGELRGAIDQVPSTVSAKRIAGKRAYALVREGVEVELPANRVTIRRFERVSPLRGAVLDGPDGPIGVVDVDVEVECSSGTYVRALARDLGKALGCGAHLTALRRTRVGVFSLEDARPLSDLEAEAGRALDEEARGGAEAALPDAEAAVPGHETAVPEGGARAPRPSAARAEPSPCGAQHDPEPAPGLIPLADAVRMLFPALVLDEEEAGRFAHGQAPSRPIGDANAIAGHRDERIIGAFNAAGEVLGLLEARKGRFATLTVFQGAAQ